MDTSNILVNTQSSIKIILDKIIYFDPFKIQDDSHDADIIFITHDHYDHMDNESINKIKKDTTIIVAPKSMEETIKRVEANDYVFLNPNEEASVLGIEIKNVRAYNNDKPFHPRNNDWLGYIISYNGITYYVAGDTDKTVDNETVKCDIALVPIGGHYTMDANEAALLIKSINPKVAIPTHYGSIIGNREDADVFKNNLSDTNIEVVIKL